MNKAMHELIRVEDGERELVDTGTAERMAVTRLDLIEDAREEVPGWSGYYIVVPADLTGCELGRAGRICPATRHASH